MKLAALDPRVKMALMLLISTLSVLQTRIAPLSLILLFTAVLLFLGGIRPSDAFFKLKTALKLVMSLLVLQLLFNRSGEPLLAVGQITLITVGGFQTAVTVTLRLMIVMLSALLILSGETADYVLGLTECRVPYEIAFMLMAGLRFLPTLRQEAQDVLYAVQMRGVDIKNLKLKAKFKIYLSVLTPIVAGAIKKSEQLSIAMEARAFRARPTRTSMRRLDFKKSDGIYLFFTSSVLLIIFLGV